MGTITTELGGQQFSGAAGRSDPNPLRDRVDHLGCKLKLLRCSPLTALQLAPMHPPTIGAREQQKLGEKFISGKKHVPSSKGKPSVNLQFRRQDVEIG